MLFKRSSGMARRFVVYGLPPSAACMLEAEVVKWETNSGPVWTVDRLKSLKQDFIRLQANLDPLTYVRKNRKGDWYGVWGFLKHFASKSLKNFEIVINCLMVYSSYIPLKIDKEHVEKMKSSVGAEPVSLPGNFLQDLALHSQSILGQIRLGGVQPLVTYRGRSSVKSPIYRGTSVAQDSSLELEMAWFDNPYHQLFFNRHFKAYKPVVEGLTNQNLWKPLKGLSGEAYHLSEYSPFETVHSRLRPAFMPCHAGSLVPLTKDGGLKVRWIASPFRLHQLALKPLGEALFGTIRQMPWDCTFNQTKSYECVQAHLKAGKTAYAVDLSAATDYFPLEVQTTILRSVMKEQDHYMIELFEELSRSKWKLNLGKREYIRWTKGQPMGLYPSFASFALAHGVLLDMISSGVPNRFFILGDDVIILHYPTYERYLQTLDLLGCPYSPHKTLTSSGLTEFAGKIITPERILSAFKWREVNDDNFIELMRTFGQRFESLLSRRERVVYQKVKRFLPPYGCNHSTGLGQPLEDVVTATEVFEASLPKARVGSVHTSFLHWLVTLLKPDQLNSLFHRLKFQWFEEKTEAFDEKVLKAFKNTHFEHFPGDRGVFADILDSLDRKITLPAVKKEWVDRTSLLEFYEGVLGLRNEHKA